MNRIDRPKWKEYRVWKGLEVQESELETIQESLKGMQVD